MDDVNFCPSCGKSVTPGTAFCPACGSNISDPGATDRRIDKFEKDHNERRLKLAVIILAISSAIAIISGLVFYLYSAQIFDAFITSDALDGSGLTWDSIVNLYRTFGMIVLIFGLAGLGAIYLIIKRRLYAVVLIVCIIVGLFGCIFCLISAYEVYKAKSLFED